MKTIVFVRFHGGVGHYLYLVPEVAIGGSNYIFENEEVFVQIGSGKTHVTATCESTDVSDEFFRSLIDALEIDEVKYITGRAVRESYVEVPF